MDRWGRKRIDEYFYDALKLAPAERAAYLDRVCRGDSGLLGEIHSLLAAHASAASFLEEPIASVDELVLLHPDLSAVSASNDALPTNTMVGRFRLVELIASGGMGAVYRAVRADDAFDQDVAVKLIRRGMLSESMCRRFHRERQTLARLEHPNITRLIDGGTSADDTPYLVMEYVDGLPIDRYCNENRLGLVARLELFRSVCNAVQFAHQNLIIHRDLKPRNILVSAAGQPKLLDFGIAALLDDESDGASADVTLTKMRALTPKYASPEQVRGEPATTATDVYSLGIVLYELLTGQRPYELDGASASHAEQIVCELVPPVPSLVSTQFDVSDVDDEWEGAHRSSDAIKSHRMQAARWRRRLRGDLDNIVMKALAKEPPRRYGSVLEFGEDLRRHLSGLPVTARQDTIAYRLSKWTRRNRPAAIAGVVTLLALVVGIIGATSGWAKARSAQRVATSERNAAVQAQSEARSVTHFLQDVLASANPYRMARDVTVEEMLEDAVRRIPTELADQPAVEAGVRLAIAQTYAGMWQWDRAAPQLRTALSLFRQVRGADHPDVAECLSLLGRALTFARDPSSVTMQREALDIRMARFGKEHPLVAESWGNLAYAQWHGVRVPDWYAAEINYRRAIDMYHRAAPDDKRNIARFTFSLGAMVAASGRMHEAEEWLRHALTMYRSMPQPEDRYVLECMKRYAFVLVRLGRYDEADAMIRETATMTPAFEESPDGRSWMWDQARIMSERGALADAEALYRSVLAGACDQLAARKPEWAEVLALHGDALSAIGDESTGPDYLEIIRLLRTHRAFGERTIAFRAIDLAVLECRKGRHERALPIFERCSEVVSEQVAPGDQALARVNLAYAECLLHVGNKAVAGPLLRNAQQDLLTVFGANHELTARAAELLLEIDDPAVSATEASCAGKRHAGFE